MCDSPLLTPFRWVVQTGGPQDGSGGPQTLWYFMNYRNVSNLMQSNIRKIRPPTKSIDVPLNMFLV